MEMAIRDQCYHYSYMGQLGLCEYSELFMRSKD
jgi:hypothetical protein